MMNTGTHNSGGTRRRPGEAFADMLFEESDCNNIISDDIVMVRVKRNRTRKRFQPIAKKNRNKVHDPEILKNSSDHLMIFLHQN